jgi:hypothetical protein
MIKKTLAARLDPDLISRLKEASRSNNATIDRTISLALDALEREQKAGNSFSERVVFLEKNLTALLDLVMTFSEKLDGKFGDIDGKFSQANVNEGERLKALYKLINTKMCEHDEAEEARFFRFVALLRGDTPP